ncbi:MAG: FKBP-type peptidyl-prolyl cis-trans isomerase [Saprospiraceae bacterium]
MQLKSVLLITLAVLTFFSCKQQGAKELKTSGGLSYTKLAEGSGTQAKPNDYVFFTLKISGDDGKVIQEMAEGPQMPIVKIPSEVNTSKNANPFEEILAKSKVGDTYSLTMPVDSIPNLPPNLASMKHIVYDFAVKDIRDEAGYTKYMDDMQAEMKAKAEESQKRLPEIESLVKKNLDAFAANTLDLKATEKGIKYHIMETGSGDPIKDGNSVSVQYYGTLKDGTMFDNSFNRGMPFTFTVGTGQVIKGWDEGLKHLLKGSKAMLFIPDSLAYGEVGQPPMIPGKSDLVFYIEVEEVQ